MVDTPFQPRKPLTLGSFLLIAVVAAALFVPTMSAHIAVMNKASIDATPTDYAVSEDGEAVVVTVEVHNPTRSAFTVAYGTLTAEVDGTDVTALSEIEEVTVPPGETRTTTARLAIRDGYHDRVAAAVESGRLSVTGNVQGTIQDYGIRVQFSGEDDDD